MQNLIDVLRDAEARAEEKLERERARHRKYGNSEHGREVRQRYYYEKMPPEVRIREASRKRKFKGSITIKKLEQRVKELDGTL